MTQHQPVFLLVDGNAIVHRAFHALPPTLTDRQGNPTNAVFGFARILLASIKQFHPEYITVAFDVPGPTHRDKLYAEYKAKRVKAPQSLYDQIPVIQGFLDCLEIPHFGITGYEADDVIGTLAHGIQSELKSVETIILTGDNDTLQLINQHTKVALPQRGIQPPQVYDATAVMGKYGLTPKQIIDFKALRGDASDNIPGVNGIGEKTAVTLLQAYKTLEAVYQNIEKITPAGVRDKLIHGQDSAYLSQELATIDTKVPLDFKLNNAKVADYDRAEAEKWLEAIGIVSLIKQLPDSHRANGDQTVLF